MTVQNLNDDPVYNKAMDTVNKFYRSKYMYFGETLNDGIKQQKFMSQHPIAMDDDNSDENAAEDEESRMELNTQLKKMTL